MMLTFSKQSGLTVVGALHDYELALLIRRIEMITDETSHLFKTFYNIPFLVRAVQGMTYSECNDTNHYLYSAFARFAMDTTRTVGGKNPLLRLFLSTFEYHVYLMYAKALGIADYN